MIIHELIEKDVLKDELRSLRKDMMETKDIETLRTLYSLERIVLRQVARDTHANVGDYI